ncbi:hypothetical protein HWV62_30419 [Athelia sp. TMB]|nr:hypothetical protein HWV62_30419 [Athelia sp. TMB]
MVKVGSESFGFTNLDGARAVKMADMERPRTPPLRTVSTANLQLTPEQVKRIEINRLKAKAKQRQKEQEASSSSQPNGNNKRPIGVTPATSNSPTAPKTQQKLKPDARLGKYFDYDLSKMVNSKGGFLVEDNKEVDEDARIKARERERERTKQNAEPPIFLDPSLNPKCNECRSMDIDQQYKKVFGCLVCNKCKNEKPEKYSLLTKTECKEDYLLTDPELRDHELMPHLLKANPHQSTYANMMLFLRYQVEEFAWKKWGSPEALDAEYEKRAAEKKKKKNKKFEEGLKDLRKRTREGVWQRRRDEEHKHVFSQVEGNGQQAPPCSPGIKLSDLTRRCFYTPHPEVEHHTNIMADIPSGDKNQAEHTHISTAVEVEKLETNLFRSKTLWIPPRARGVFGGQVISQALCYFLLSASPAVPIVYSVECLREGRSYTTRLVKAVQKGATIFVLMASFHKSETWQPEHHWSMPLNVPAPEDCVLEEVAWAKKLASTTGVSEKWKNTWKTFIEERSRSPIAVKVAKYHDVDEKGIVTYAYWMSARSLGKNTPAPFQKCIVAYLSDLYFVGTASRTLGLERNREGENSVGMVSSLDHSIYYYDNDFDCDDWLLYVVTSPRTGMGRGTVLGRVSPLLILTACSTDVTFLRRYTRTLAIDLLNPSAEYETRQHKLKRLVQSPNSFFMDVKCPGCFAITTVFSHAQTVVLCGSCASVLCQPTGGKARLTEGASLNPVCSYGKGVLLTSVLVCFSIRVLFPQKELGNCMYIFRVRCIVSPSFSASIYLQSASPALSHSLLASSVFTHTAIAIFLPN